MTPLEKLLQPYRDAVSGQATPTDYLRQDPVYSTLFPAVTAQATRGNAGQQGGAPSSLIGLAKRLERMGFDVGELEGFQGEGQISSGHADNSHHYKGNAADINWRGGDRFRSEGQALNWLAKYI